MIVYKSIENIKVPTERDHFKFTDLVWRPIIRIMWNELRLKKIKIKCRLVNGNQMVKYVSISSPSVMFPEMEKILITELSRWAPTFDWQGIKNTFQRTSDCIIWSRLVCFYRNKPHINFIEGCQHGTGVLRFLQPLSDAQSHAVHLHLQQNHKRAEQENVGPRQNLCYFLISVHVNNTVNIETISMYFFIWPLSFLKSTDCVIRGTDSIIKHHSKCPNGI